MTNYSNYPRHRLVSNSCIICFSPTAYSWCSLTGSTKKYLLTNYIDGARLSSKSDEILEKKKKESEKVCPLCGGALVLRVAKFGPKPGSQFYGCKNFPECKYTAPYEAEESKEGD